MRRLAVEVIGRSKPDGRKDEEMVERGDSVSGSQRSLRALTFSPVTIVCLAARLSRYVLLFRAAFNINTAIK